MSSPATSNSALKHADDQAEEAVLLVLTRPASSSHQTKHYQTMRSCHDNAELRGRAALLDGWVALMDPQHSGTCGLVVLSAYEHSEGLCKDVHTVVRLVNLGFGSPLCLGRRHAPRKRALCINPANR